MGNLTIVGNPADDLRQEVEATINKLLDERKLRWLSNTQEFKEGLLIGLELAGIYGKDIQKLYSSST